MRHHVKPRCKFDCRFVQVGDELWLCPHASYGPASYMRGAVEDARALLEKSGGYDAVLSRIIAKEDEQRAAARAARGERSKRLADSLKYVE